MRDHILFGFDDAFFLPTDFPNSHIRGLRFENWSYAVYFSSSNSTSMSSYEFEMYDLAADKGQMNNLIFACKPSLSAAVKEIAMMLHQRLNFACRRDACLTEDVWKVWPKNPCGW